MGTVGFCRRTLSGLAVLVLCGSASAPAESLDQLYQKAKAEQSLSLYGGGPAAGYERWTREFEQRFRGKRVATYPHDNDVSLYAFYLIVKKYGWSYMDKFMANEPSFIQGHLGVVRGIAAGEYLATFDGSMDAQLELAKTGRPMGVRFSEVDPTPIWPLTAAIFKDAPHGNAAKLYLTWYLAKEQQSRIGTSSPRSDVPPPAGLKPLFSYLAANKYRAFITNTRLVDGLRQRFEACTGPVVNKGGIR